MRAAAWILVLLALPAMASDAPFDAPDFPRTSDLAATAAPRPFALRAYDLLSRFDGPRCPHRPSCSAYAAQAVHDHGPALGAVIGAARLLRGERSSGQSLLPRDADGLLLDPLEESTFFLRAASTATSGAQIGPFTPSGTSPQAAPSRNATPASTAADPPAPPSSAGDIALAAEALRFADWLLERGDLYRAIGEYERHLFLAPGGAEAGRAELQIARAYALGRQTDAAAAVLRRLERDATANPAVRDAALFEHGLVRFRAGDPARAIPPLAAYADLPAPAAGPGAGPARLLLGLARLRGGDPTAADREFEAAAADATVAAAAGDLREAAREVARAPSRSPVAAGLLSAVVPGLGHVYAGDPASGAGALALNAVFLWATVEAFRDHRPGLGLVLAGAESIWYGGAIFGAVSDAMRFNRDARAAALGRVEQRFRWVIDAAPLRGGGAAAGVRGAF